MKIGIKVKYKKKVINLSVHELLGITQKLMQQRYNDKKGLRMHDLHHGEKFFPIKLTTPDEWLRKSRSLKQGV